MTDSAKDVLLRTYRAELNVVAETWLGAGAAGILLTSKGHLVASWGAVSCIFDEAIEARIDDAEELDLFVCVPPTEANKAHLDADVAMLRRLLIAENELERLADELVIAQDQLQAMYDVSQMSRSYLDFPPMLTTLAQECAQSLEADSAVIIYRPSDDTVYFGQFPLQRPLKQYTMQLYEEMLALGQTLVITDKAELASSFVNAMMIPVKVRGQVQAALGFFDRAYGFASPQIKLASALADQLSERIESIELYRESLQQSRIQAEMTLAAEVQHKLLPSKLPCIDGLDLHALSDPALHVGGDFFDFIPVGDGAYFLILGDVTGKGMSAALVMAMIRTTLRGIANQNASLSPAELVAAANQSVYDDFTEIGVFTTLFVGLYRPGDNVLTIANAGHSPVIYRSTKHKAHLLEADGTAIGILPVSFSEDHTVRMEIGDVLLIATDGFSEAANLDGDMLGHERLCYLLDANHHRIAESISDMLRKAVMWFENGAAQTDDRTLIVIKRV